MSLNKNVILGEASESDSEEEISLGDSNEICIEENRGQFEQLGHKQKKQEVPVTSQSNDVARGSNVKPSLFASASSIASKLAHYAPYNLIGPLGTGNQVQLPFTSSFTSKKAASSFQDKINSLPPLHKTLLSKNQQLYDCTTHMYRHPYQKAANDLNTISQRLVAIQLTFQDIDAAVIELSNQQKQLNFDINFIV